MKRSDIIKLLILIAVIVALALTTKLDQTFNERVDKKDWRREEDKKNWWREEGNNYAWDTLPEADIGIKVIMVTAGESWGE